MKHGTFAGLLGMAVAAGLSLAAHAEIKDNPYQVIIDRNPFGLRPIPPPEPPKKDEGPPAEPPPDIKLTGITTLLGKPKVFLQLEDKKTKKPSFPPPMAEGDTENGITVLAIDADNMKVRVKNGDAETTLNFKDNGVKAAAVASVAPVPHPTGVVPLNPAGVPAPVPGIPGQSAAATSGRGAIVAGGTATSTPGVPNPAAAYANPAAGAPYSGLPQRPLRTDSNPLSIVAGGGGQVYNPAPTPQLNPQPTMSKEEAELRIEEYRQRLKQQQQAGQTIPHSPTILPPTSLGRAIDGATPAPAVPR